jgi:hypothetical protein
MSNAICSTPSTNATVHHGRARRLRSAGQSLLDRRGISDVAGVISGMTFVLARVPVYAVALLFAAAASIAGLLLYGARALVRRLGGAHGPEVAATPGPQSLAVGGPHG